MRKDDPSGAALSMVHGLHSQTPSTSYHRDSAGLPTGLLGWEEEVLSVSAQQRVCAYTHTIHKVYKTKHYVDLVLIIEDENAYCK